MEDPAFLLDVVGKTVRHQAVVRAEDDDAVPLHAFDAVDGRQRHSFPLRWIVVDLGAAQVFAQPCFERRRIGMHVRDRDEGGEVVEV